MYKNLMIDIETLDTSPTNKAVVVSVGMVKFNLLDEDTWETIEADSDRSGYWVLSIDEQLKKGRTIGASTLLWWINQIRTGHPDAASIFSPHPQGWHLDTGQFRPDAEQHILTQLLELGNFIDADMYGWGKPAHFDLPKMASLFESFDMEFPIPWYKYRCMRGAITTANIFDTPRPKFHTKGNVDHHALWDATEQVLELQGWFHNMRR